MPRKPFAGPWCWFIYHATLIAVTANSRLQSMDKQHVLVSHVKTRIGSNMDKTMKL
jgi:hypothetical protein